jgi:hypothetical protein
MRTRFGWCHATTHTPYAHFEKADCVAFTIWASEARPLPPKVCGDTRDGYTCTLAPHAPRIDHAQVGHVAEVPYTIAFWNYGHGITRLDAVVVVTPFPKDRIA